MLFKSALVTQASGSLGGLVASHNRGGLYLRARTIPTDPNTPAQAFVRAGLGFLVNRWVNELSAFQRQSWELYASNVPITGPLGDPVTISGQNHYIRSNLPRLQVVTSIVNIAPFIFDTGTLTPPTITNASEAVQQVTINFTEADDWNIANGHLIIQQSRPVNQTINFFRGPYRFMGSVNGVDVTPSIKPVVFPFVADQRLYFRVRASFADGRLTQTQFIGPVDTIA